MPLPVTDFIIERLLEFDSSFDTGGGISTTALMINPLAVILQPLRDELDEIQANQSILSVLESDDPDAFDEEIVDALASNVFIDRQPGNVSSGTVRIRFFSPQDLDIGTGLASFLDGNNNRYVNVSPISITIAEMSLNVEGSLYYVNVPVEAEEEGSDQNVEVGSIQTFENEPANVANVTNLSKFSSGTDRETNTELIDRIRVAVTVRALVTGRGIITTMTDNFSSIEEINPRGFGDPEMQRDIVFNVHIGGNVDIWVKTPEFTNSDFDVISVIADTTRQTPEKASVVFLVDSPTTYPLRHSGIDRTNSAPTAVSSDGLQTFLEGIDYTISDIAGTVSRLAAGNIYHDSGTASTGITTTKTIVDPLAPWTNVRPGMRLTIAAPSAAAGTYSVKTVSATTITIFGTFPVASEASVPWAVDDVVVFSYEYNPLSIDIIKEVRTASREDYTITDVPIMEVVSIEQLDPTTLQPTGTFLDPLGGQGGYGEGAYGVGPFGAGTVPDYVLKIGIPNLRYSVDEDNFIVLASQFLGFSFRVNYDYASEIQTYQMFVDDTQNNVETASLKVKHFIPVFVDTVTPITYYVQASNTAAKTAAENQTEVENFIEDINIRNNLELSDIIDLLYNNGADRVDLNFTLKGEIHNTDGSLQFTNSTDEGLLEIPENVTAGVELPDTDKPLSKEIAHFLPGTVVLNRVTT